ncbi:sulfurtransferase [Altererythrobacter xixiisoli]|uniref:Sulfurtransferase n=1 Tax=Croceibacterium xixiisoli TaxID=1476466 RepID=A0A6I4TQ17_9SPHN|nr:sulfurtransferase [Croceibacterium xixiisoli]MXO98225.1 sulfurtransferase [Croceibacterium xixiisoli]
MDMIVSTEWLAGHLAAAPGSAGFVILDASAHLPDAKRDARAEFAAEHIPGARFLDLATLIDPDSAVPAAIPTAEQFAARMGQLGVHPGDTLVIYDDSAVKTSARAWFIARLHGARAAILDGGLGKWRAEGRPLESGDPAHVATSYSAEAGEGLVRNKAEMLDNLTSKREQVVDARGAARFSGAEGDFRPNVASGHIPGSVNLPFGKLYNADGTFKDEAGLRAAFAEAGVDIDAPVATTCGGGVTAAVLLFALALLGKSDVSLYDGSWSEWGTDPATPKELSPGIDGAGA